MRIEPDEDDGDTASGPSTDGASFALGFRPGDSPGLVVGLGASAGGLQALEQFFETLRPPTGMAFVIVQHLSPHFKSLMDELLSRHSFLKVERAENGVRILADHAYLMPPGVEMILSGDCLLLTEKDPMAKLSFPIDQFFRSLAQEYADRAVAIILSGTGSDGSRGIVDVHNAGGLVLVQEEGSAKFTGMPNNAMRSGVVGHSVKPQEMPALLRTHLENLECEPERQPLAPDVQEDDGIREIFKLLNEDFKIDFSMYRPTTIARRTQRRLLMNPGYDLKAYVRSLRDSQLERQALYHDLLIGVTSFFRDEQAFARLENDLLPQCIGGMKPGDEFRAWVAGCASGEEAYSLAILVDEVMRRLGKSFPVKIFATDVHKPSLEIAGAGVYPEESLTGVSGERLERYFSRKEGCYQVTTRVREMLIFAPHNVMRDSPFTRLHLVTCRNLLIYFQPSAQKKVLGLFHFALKTGGLLFLGASESLGDYTDEFDPVDDHWRIFRKRRDVRLHGAMDVFPGLGNHTLRELGLTPQTFTRGANPLQPVFEKLLAEMLPSSILVGEGRQVVHTFGDASRYLELRPGRPSLDLLDMVGGDMKILLAGGLQRAERQRSAVRMSNMKARDSAAGGDDASPELVDVTILPIEPGGSGPSGSAAGGVGATGSGRLFFLISFQPHNTPTISIQSGGDMIPGLADDKAHQRIGTEEEMSVAQASRDRVESLERELRNLQESLQITIEELETSNEELEASNEELLAANEELQSTNEELHSVNEELYTVNTEHQKKIEELRLLNRDMENLFSSAEIHTLFLDEKLLIRKFTPRMGELFNLIGSDIGRRIDTFVHTIRCPDLQDRLDRALKDNERFEAEVQDRGETSYLMRVFPYQGDQPCSGVVFTLIDITPFKQAEQQFRTAVETAPGAILMVDQGGLVRLANSRTETMFGYRADELIGRPIELLIPERFRGQHGGHRDRYFREPTLRPMGTGMPLIGLRKSGEEFPIDVQLSPLKTTDGNFVLAAVIDHSETKRLERSLRDQLENRDLFLAMLSHELRNPLGAVLNAATIIDRIAAPDEPMREFIGLIVGQARQMSRLLDDLLDVSRVSQGKVKLRKEVLDLRDVIREAASATEYLVNGRNQNLRIQLPERPCNIDADRGRMIQVLENLFTNASKYTPDSGSIDVALQTAPGHSTLFVRDNGRGIAQDKLETIFDMFAQCESSIDRRDAGMGVGLTLVKSIVEMHGGSVTARSAGLGQGSEFVVVMPTTEAAIAPAQIRPAASPSRSLRIVLVEDNDESRRTLKMLLELDGYSVQTASDGHQGLELIQAEKPDAAILDIGLPGINGYELAGRLREDFPPDRLHLIALTGYGRAEDRAAVSDAGFNDHLVKPIQIDMLLASLARADGTLRLRQDTAADG